MTNEERYKYARMFFAHLLPEYGLLAVDAILKAQRPASNRPEKLNIPENRVEKARKKEGVCVKNVS